MYGRDPASTIMDPQRMGIGRPTSKASYRMMVEMTVYGFTVDMWCDPLDWGDVIFTNTI